MNEIFPDVSALCRSSQQIQATGNKLQLEAVRLNPLADGYCLHAFTDGDWVLGAGVLDVWRQPKAQYESLKAVQQPLYVAIRTEHANVDANRGTALTITAVNDRADVDGELALTALDANGRTVWQTRQTAVVKHGITRLYQGRLETATWQGKHTISARILSGGKTVSENSYGILVMPSAELQLPVVDFSVMETRDQLRSFFRAAGRPCRLFSGVQLDQGPALVADNDASNEKDLAQFVRLMDWVKRGGVAVWLRVPAAQFIEGDPIYRDTDNNYMLQLRGKGKARPTRQNALLETGVFPFALQQRNARGNWIPVGHYFRRHAVFTGLPSEGFLDQPYQNLVPLTALMNAPGEELAGCVAWSATPHDYYPKLEAWQAADLAVAPHGKGTMILSTFQILEHLGRDPLADKLLGNLLRYADTLRQPIDKPDPSLDQQIELFQRKFRQTRLNTSR